MKNKLTIFLSALLFLMLWSCKKDEHKDYFEGGTAPVLSSSPTGSIPLSFTTKDQEAIRLSWTNPEYKFTTGVSSQNVSYQLEIDTTGSNFTNPQRKVIALSNNLGITISQNDFNDYLLNQLVLKPGVSHNVEMRVTSLLTNNSVPLYSNVLKFAVTPYSIPPKVTPPASGKLFITGSATPKGWMGGGDPEVPAQQFTQVSPTLYVLNHINLTGGQSYLFVPAYGDWNAKYGGTGANNKNNVNGDDFKANGGDLLAPATSGDYKIQVDFQRGKFTVTPN
jgi:hypothetical protein